MHARSLRAKAFRRLSASTLALVTLALTGASVRAASLDLATLWPNADGLAWSFAQHTEVLRPAPSTQDRAVRLIFSGTTTAPSNVDAQVLSGDVTGPMSTAAADPLARDPFLRTLASARPDLAPALATAAALAACPGSPIAGFDAVLLNAPHAWRRDAAEIAAWRCNLTDTRSWKWLDADLATGGTFDLQLVPDLASDVWLHATNGPTEGVTVPAGTFANALRVDYVVDYGVAVCNDPGGNPVGTYRAITRGSVWWADGVGPVKSTEEFLPYAEVTGGCTPPVEIGQPSVRVTLELSTLPVAARSATWGALKTRYR